MREFESCHFSHPVRQKRESQRRPQKSPPFVDFSTTANSLHVPKLGKSPANSPKVSTESLNYSRFLESLIGDYFDRRMGAHRSAVATFLPLNTLGTPQKGPHLQQLFLRQQSVIGGTEFICSTVIVVRSGFEKQSGPGLRFKCTCRYLRNSAAPLNTFGPTHSTMCSRPKRAQLVTRINLHRQRQPFG